MTHSVLLRIDTNVIQDDLRRLLRFDRLFDKMSAQDFISGGWNRNFKVQVNKSTFHRNVTQQVSCSGQFPSQGIEYTYVQTRIYHTIAAREKEPRNKFWACRKLYGITIDT
jgi:hypothetical protein